VYFDTAEIPPGAPRQSYPRASATPQFQALLQAYPDVHLEDFVIFGILQEQPRRGTHAEWGQIAGVLSHMIGGRNTLVDVLVIIVNRIQRLHRDDPMRETEEQELANFLLRERRCSSVPLGEASFP